MRKLLRILLLLLAVHLTSLSCTEVSRTGASPEPEKDKEYVRNHYSKREVTIEMRDGIRLHTSIYTPRDTSRTYPILLKRTPYSCRPY